MASGEDAKREEGLLRALDRLVSSAFVYDGRRQWNWDWNAPPLTQDEKAKLETMRRERDLAAMRAKYEARGIAPLEEWDE